MYGFELIIVIAAIGSTMVKLVVSVVGAIIFWCIIMGLGIILLGLGVVPGAIALYFCLMILETPHYTRTIDVRQKANNDVNKFLQISEVIDNDDQKLRVAAFKKQKRRIIATKKQIITTKKL